MRRLLGISCLFFIVLLLPAQRNSFFAWGSDTLRVALQENNLLFSINDNKPEPILRIHHGGSRPQIAVDTVSPEFKGRIYLCWSEKINGKNNEDVFLVYSDDRGKNWTDRILLTYHPNHKHQWGPKISVDPKGRVTVLYFDAKNYEGSTLFDITIAVSTNGGLKFEQYRLNRDPLGSLSNPTFRFDAYNLITIKSKNLRQKFYVNDTSLKNLNAPNVKVLEIPKTITWNDSLLINFKSAEKLDLTVTLNKPLDPLFRKSVVQERKVMAGKNKLLIDFRKLGQQKDNYVLNLYYNGITDFIWILKE